MKVESVMPPAVSSVVLVVDDAPDTLRMLCDALAIEGYTVLVARDAIEALERFEMSVSFPSPIIDVKSIIAFNALSSIRLLRCF
mgnify:CR=1 FL=1